MFCIRLVAVGTGHRTNRLVRGSFIYVVHIRTQVYLHYTAWCVEREVTMPYIQWGNLPPGGRRLETIRFELGYLDRKEFARLLSIHPSDYCRILRYERLSIPRLVKIFIAIIDTGYYTCFEAVRSDFDLFDDGCFKPHVYFALRKRSAIVTLKKAYDKSINRYALEG